MYFTDLLFNHCVYRLLTFTREKQTTNTQLKVRNYIWRWMLGWDVAYGQHKWSPGFTFWCRKGGNTTMSALKLLQASWKKPYWENKFYERNGCKMLYFTLLTWNWRNNRNLRPFYNQVSFFRSKTDFFLEWIKGG